MTDASVRDAVAVGAVTVVPARQDHVDAIVRIWHDGWVDGHLGHVPDALVAHRTKSEFRRRAIDRLPVTWVARLGAGPDAEVVGFVVIQRDEVEQLYVDERWRGSGVAARLLDEAEGRIGDTYRCAWLAVVAGNRRARRFYERRGWRDRGGIEHRAEITTGSMLVPARRYEKAVGPGSVA